MRLAAVAAIAIGAPHLAHAQAQPPGGGQLLQQLTPPPEAPPPRQPSLSIEQRESARSTSGTPIAVERIRIVGNTLIPTAELRALVSGAEGRRLTLGQLQALAGRITALYRRRGYLLARAYVPAQTVRNGEVTLAVLEARYGKVTLDNSSTTSDRPLKATLSALQSGAPVSEAALDRTLLLLSDIPGVVVSSTIRPGTATGTSDLLVDATSGPRYSGSLAVDDYGNRYTSRPRGSATLNINSLAGEGDRLGIDVLTSGSGMSYGQLRYQYLLDGEGTTVGASASYLHYELEGDLTSLQAHGTAQVDSVNVAQPIIRGTAGNLYAQLELDHKQLHDDIDVAAIRGDRRINDAALVLAGDRRDDRGVTNFSLSAAAGRVTFEDAAAQLADSLGADTQGVGAHYDLTLARLQRLGPQDGLYAAITGQLASRNLDPADQFYLGGPSNARGYDVGALTGARGYLGSLEWRHTLAASKDGAWLASLFADRGRIEVYENTFAPGLNVADLTDAGAGLHWDGPAEWVVSLQAAARIGPSSPLLHPGPRARVWLQVQKGFESR